MTSEAILFKTGFEGNEGTDVELSWQFIDGFKAEYKRMDVDHGGTCDINAGVYCMGWEL